MEEQEQIWVEQARKGEQAAFSKLVEAYQKPVYNLAYRMLGNSVEADDAAQETFIRMYTRLHTYDPKRKFSSWLLAIASHYCIDMLRRRRVTFSSFEDLPPMVELSMPHAKQPEQMMLNDQNTDAVQALLNTLAPSYRVPVILKYWYDMSYQEISETMGVTQSTVKTRLHRARNKLAGAVLNNSQGMLQPVQ